MKLAEQMLRLELAADCTIFLEALLEETLSNWALLEPEVLTHVAGQKRPADMLWMTALQALQDAQDKP